MKRYVVRRLLMAIPLLLAISFVCFCFINLIPSNPAEVALRVQQTPVITDEIIAAMEEQLGLNKPFFVRYFDWVLGCLHGDFGISYVNPKRTVAGELLRCLPATLQLAGTSFVIVVVLSIPIGFLCAVYKDGWFDKIMRGLVFVTTAMPAYWVGLLLMWGIGVKLNWLPTNGNGTWRHLILPSFTVALSYISTYIRLIRNNMLENMKQDYVLYANVRGLPQKSILVKHILKNSMHTCIVAMGMSIPQLISGTISLGAILGIMAGYFRGIVEEVIMRVVDVMLSFPSQIMVFAVVALLGVSVQNVIIANVFIKWAWYARMIRTGVMQYRDRNFVQFSRCVGMPERFILFRHLLPSITSDLVVLASLDVGWAIINISTLSFLGLGVQAPTPEWGAMLNEAKNVMTSNPVQMIAPGIAIVVLVCVFNLMGDALRDVLDPKEVQK